MHFRKQIFIILLSILLFTSLLTAVNWTYSTVGTAPNSTRPVICSDPLWNLHIAWTSDDIYGELVQYANNQTGSWSYQKQVAGSSGNQAYCPSITADIEGFAYIIFRYSDYNFEPRYVSNRNITSSYWNQTRPMSGGHYHEVSIEVDNDFQTHVFAQEDTYGSNIYYQQFNTNNIVIPNIQQFYGTAIDQNDNLHFVGYNDGTGIYYTSYDGSSWSATDTIDQVDVAVYHPAISCDANNVLHVVFSSNDGIYYINNSSGDWSVPELATTGGIFPNVVADENSNAHVAYYTKVEYGTLFYTNNISGSWLTSEFITTINTDLSSATEDAAHVESKIALDPKSNTVNIVYISNGTDVTLAQTSDFNLRRMKSTDTSSTLISLATTPPNADTLSASASGSHDLLQFVIEDNGGDGLPIKINELIIQSGPGMSTDVCFNDVFSKVTLTGTDGTNLDGTIYGSKIFFGSLDYVWKEIPENTSVEFTVSATLKQPLQNITNKSVQMKVNGLYDIITDPGGSQFTYTSQNVLSDTLFFHVVPDHFEFVNLGSDFYDENLIEGFWMQVKIVDANGNIAVDVTGIDLTLSAVELDGVNPTSQALQSTEELTKTLTDGYAQWNNLTFPEQGQIRILATCDVLTAASDTITVMPLHRNLVITSDEAVETTLKNLNIDSDYYSESNYQFPTDTKIAGYESILLFPSSTFAAYIDSMKLKSFLETGTDTARKSILAFGAYGLGSILDSPFANNYFGARFGNYFNHQATSFSGVAGDPITDGLSLSAGASYFTTELLFNDNANNTTILTEIGTGKVVGVRHDRSSFRTAMITPEFSILNADADRDSMLSKILQWFGEQVQTAQGPTLSALPDIDMTEDIPHKMAISDWYQYIEDTDTPDEDLTWDLGPGYHNDVSIENDTLLIVPEENFYGRDTLIVTISDGQLTDTGSVVINVASVNDPPENFALLSPNDETVILDTALIYFKWEIANDVESGSVNYILYFQNNELDTTINNNNSHELYIDASIFPTGVDISWTVLANDYEDTTTAENAPFSFLIQPLLDISGDNNNLPETYMLYPNYPNPFNPETNIQYGLPEESFVTLSIYNINGRLVQTLVQDTRTAGYHIVTWQAEHMVSGVYFYQITAGDFKKVRKCLLIK